MAGTGTIGNLSAQIPVANQRLAQQQQAARDIQMQAAIGQARPAQATPQTAQSLGTAVAQQAGQQQVAQVGQQAQAQAQTAQLQQQVQQLQDTKTLNDQKAGLADQQFSGAQQLSQISEAAKQEMYDSRRQFAQNELGRSFSNERQLADYAKLKAGNDEQWQNYQQSTNQLMARKSDLLQSSYDKLSQQLQFENQKAIQLREQAASITNNQALKDATLQSYRQKLDETAKIRAAQVELGKSLARQQSKAAATSAKNQALGTIAGAGIGAVAGSVLAGPAGTAAGASIGSSVGTGLASLLGK